jgi:hypothetical protein
MGKNIEQTNRERGGGVVRFVAAALVCKRERRKE